MAAATFVQIHAAAQASPTPKQTFPPAPPSAIGNEMVQWLAVSPAYKTTGLVVAQATQLNCPKNTQCVHLWISHDGGATWHRAAAKGWNGGRAAIAVDSKGNETMFAGVSRQLARSDDYGDTWSTAGAGGVPTVLPTYARDGGVAVAAAGKGTDYLLHGTTPQNVQGSGGADTDVLYMVSPTFPNAGSFSPSLLTALDHTSSALVVLHCTTQFACGTPTVIPGPASGSAMTGAGTVLLPSSGYANDGTVFADTPLGVDKSTDGGITFTPLNIVPTTGAKATTTPMMALAPGYTEHGGSRTAYVAVFQLFESGMSGHTTGGIYGTTDGGSTWDPVGTTGPFSGGAQAVAVAPDGRLFAGFYDGYGHGGLLCSTNQGRTWSVTCPPVGTYGHPSKSSSGNSNGGTCAQTATTCAPQSVNGGGGSDTGAGGAGAEGPGTPVTGATAANLGKSSSGPRTVVLVALILAGALLTMAAVRTVIRRRLPTHRTER